MCLRSLNPSLVDVPQILRRGEINIAFELRACGKAKLLCPQEIVGELVGDDALHAGVKIAALVEIVDGASLYGEVVEFGGLETGNIEQVGSGLGRYLAGMEKGERVWVGDS